MADAAHRPKSITYVTGQSFCVKCRGVMRKAHTCNPTGFTIRWQGSWSK